VGTKLDTTVNVATLLAAVGILITLGMRAQSPAASGRPPGVPEPMKVGERVPAFDGLNFARSRQTLALFLRHDCRFCAESMPFYRRLRSGESPTAASHPDTQLVTITLDEASIAKQYIAANHLTLDALIAVPSDRRREVRLYATPTVLLLDGSGVIKKMWTGRLDETHENEVLAALAPERN
jgi:hypothetical protein